VIEKELDQKIDTVNARILPEIHNNLKNTIIFTKDNCPEGWTEFKE